jgi:hypothetical protein
VAATCDFGTTGGAGNKIYGRYRGAVSGSWILKIALRRVTGVARAT